MSNQPIIVTIDGPAGTGKSTIARDLAKRLNLDFLDTGAMYRVIALLTIDAGLNIPFDTAEKQQAVTQLAQEADIAFEWHLDPPRIFVRSSVMPVAEGSVERIEINERIRTPQTSERVSHIAAISGVRKIMVEAQQRIGREHTGLVTEGRDQGSVVFPDALMKFYLDATPEERANRRIKQLEATGIEFDRARIKQNILERDRLDMSRKDGPLVCPDGAQRIDTTQLTIDEVLNKMESAVNERLGQLEAMI